MELKIGLKYTCPSKGKNWYGKIINITDTTVHVEFYRHNQPYGTGSDPIETVINYFETGYFKIKNDFVLPKKWAVKQEHDLICKYFNETFGSKFSDTTGIYYLHNIPNDKNFRQNESKPMPGYTLITFEQFKQYVLKEKPEILNYTKLINMLKYINERNRTLT